MKHSLTDKDTAALTATCSVCGPEVAIVRVGNGHGCRLAVRTAKRNYKKAHPDRARAGRQLPPSPHRLTARDGGPDTCAVCGPVTPDPWGRGWICPTLRKEKGWPVSQTEPAPKCSLCNRRWLIDGKCPSCDAVEKKEAGFDPAFVSELYEAGMHIETNASWLPADSESTVHGWKTLGSTKPFQGVRPEYAALYGSGSR